MNLGDDPDSAPAALDAAVESGFTAFDHADIYGAGASETVFGAWLADHRELREDILIQSKCGIQPGEPVMYDFSRHHIVTSGTAVNQREPAMTMRAGEVIDYCRLNGITLQAWGPLAQGRYSGREDNSAARVVSEMAERYGVSREAIVLAWLLRHPAPIMPVIGTTNPGRIAACAEADTIILDRVDWFRLLEAGRGVGMP